VNEAEKKLRDAWADASDRRRNYVCNWEDDGSGVHALGSAVRAFCESAPVEGGEDLRAKIAAAEKERDRAQDDAAVQRQKQEHLVKQLAATEKERDEAKREAEAMRDLATRNANELNAAVKERDEFKRHHESTQCALHNLRCHSDAAQRSYRAQIGELTRALEAENKAHSEALRPDEYTRAAVACAEALADARVSYSDFEPIRERWQEIYTARQRGEPSAPAMLEVCAAAKEWREAPTGQAVVTASKRLWAALDALEACRE